MLLSTGVQNETVFPLPSYQRRYCNPGFTLPKIARKPSIRPFASEKSRNLKNLMNSRAVQSREYRLAKRGIELSELRDDESDGLNLVDRIIEVRRRAGSAFMEKLKKEEELVVKKDQERME